LPKFSKTKTLPNHILNFLYGDFPHFLLKINILYINVSLLLRELTPGGIGLGLSVKLFEIKINRMPLCKHSLDKCKYLTTDETVVPDSQLNILIHKCWFLWRETEKRKDCKLK